MVPRLQASLTKLVEELTEKVHETETALSTEVTTLREKLLAEQANAMEATARLQQQIDALTNSNNAAVAEWETKLVWRARWVTF